VPDEHHTACVMVCGHGACQVPPAGAGSQPVVGDRVVRQTDPVNKQLGGLEGARQWRGDDRIGPQVETAPYGCRRSKRRRAARGQLPLFVIARRRLLTGIAMAQEVEDQSGKASGP